MLLPILLTLFFSTPSLAAALVPLEIPINSGRPTFTYDLPASIPGKIVMEEHVSTSLFQAAYTTPFENYTNEISYGTAAYISDVATRLNVSSITDRVAQMDQANISISVVSLVPPGIQGIFNATLAVELAPQVNNEFAAGYKDSNFSSRFEFFCSVALIDPAAAAAEMDRCVHVLGGVGVMVGGYTNNGSVNDIIYLDDPSNDVFWEKLVELNVPLYLHPRMPAPNQQRVYADYPFLAGSPYGYSAETGAHALRLMVSGVFDRFPSLQIILGHCGEGLPFFLARIDQRFRHFRHADLWPAKQTMSHYWAHNFYTTTAGVQDDAALLDTLRVTGAERVMFSVDYPFEDDLEIASWFDRLELNEETKQKIAYGNARSLLKLGKLE